MISFFSSLKIINVVVSDPNIFFWLAGSVAAAAVNPNGIITLLANGLGTFFLKGKSVFSNGPRGLPRIPPDCTILGNWVFDNSILVEKPFEKALGSFKT